MTDIVVTLAPVGRLDGDMPVYGAERDLGDDRMEGSLVLRRSLNLFPADTDYTATTGELTLTLVDSNGTIEAELATSPHARIRVYRPVAGADGAETRRLLWTGVVVSRQPLPSKRQVRLRVRDFVEVLASGTAPAAADPASAETMGHIDYLRPPMVALLGYDPFAEVGGDGQVQIHPPAEDSPLLETAQNMLFYLSASRRYWVDGRDGQVVVRRLVPRDRGVTLTETNPDHRWLEDWTQDDGRGQVWNDIRYEYRGADGEDAEGVVLAEAGDTIRAPTSRLVYGTRELTLNLKHLGAAAARAVAERVLYEAIYARLRVSCRMPAVEPLGLGDVVTLNYNGEYDTMSKAVRGKWAIQELGVNLTDAVYDLELVRLTHFDAVEDATGGADSDG